MFSKSNPQNLQIGSIKVMKMSSESMRTSCWSDMKQVTSNPPIECEIMLTFLPPEALYAVSSFSLSPSIPVSILQQ